MAYVSYSPACTNSVGRTCVPFIAANPSITVLQRDRVRSDYRFAYWAVTNATPVSYHVNLKSDRVSVRIKSVVSRFDRSEHYRFFSSFPSSPSRVFLPYITQLDHKDVNNSSTRS